MSERTPEFKDGAKTINFRRILLTKCYESLIEEPDNQPLHLSNKKGGSNGQNGASQHSWRRKCMLQNVGFVGELFRRQLLTENIMHVCVAMMLDDEVKPQAEIIEAACGLLNLLKTVRVGGWINNRQENSSASSTPAASPAKLADGTSNATAKSPVSNPDPVPTEAPSDDPTAATVLSPSKPMDV
ncbi:unnamed protein product [Phytophthora fragariaefolia]|uniref:Unnamed protein product n=1 Tax=Phytophthora fragariaefolia TaxID=1490495 RepID=A0A9W6XYE9_9STRA|nr:unnamed protein product [Phytophthora fragariaefolia]